MALLWGVLPIRGWQELGFLFVGLLRLPVGLDLLDEVLAFLLWGSGRGLWLQAGAWQGVDRLSLQPVDQLFADQAAQVEEFAGVLRRNDRPDPH